MCWRKLLTCSLLAGLMVSTHKAGSQTLRLLRTQHLPFPSASALEYAGNRLYVLGDDAPYVLVLSTTYQVLDSIRYWPRLQGRIPKPEKPDIEAAYLKTEGKKTRLIGVASHSAANRRTSYVFPLRHGKISRATIIAKQPPALQVLNIEGACTVNGTLVLANRGNLAVPENHLLYRRKNGGWRVQRFRVAAKGLFAGVSGLYYLASQDRLLFTASEEATASATADGAIGDSYLGWVDGFSKKQRSALLVPTGLLNLTRVDSAFHQQKIESVCVETADAEGLLLHLAADNDNGQSRLFTARLKGLLRPLPAARKGR